MIDMREKRSCNNTETALVWLKDMPHLFVLGLYLLFEARCLSLSSCLARAHSLEEEIAAYRKLETD